MLNAAPPGQPAEATERTARHLLMYAELADLAMQLARAAAARTLADWAEPAEPPAAEPPSPPTAAPLADPAAISRRATASPAPAKPANPAILFTRFAAIARGCIALEARLAATLTAAPPRQAQSLQLRADPRRPLLREAFTRALKNHPDRAELQRETAARVDAELTADPDHTTGSGRLYVDICKELGIAVDYATMPDALLNTCRAPAHGNATPASNPRATAPPAEARRTG